MRIPRIQSRKVAQKATCINQASPSLSPAFDISDFIKNQEPPQEKTPSEKLYYIIEDECIWGNRFTDTFYGIPWIEKTDIEDKGKGLFIVRFRCPPEFMHHVYFGKMAESVCKRVNSGMHIFHETRIERYSEKVKLPYEECVWVIQENELDNR